MTAYIKDDNYTIVLVNNSTSKAFETKLEIEGKEFQTMISYTSDEGVKWQRKKVIHLSADCAPLQSLSLV